MYRYMVRHGGLVTALALRMRAVDSTVRFCSLINSEKRLQGPLNKSVAYRVVDVMQLLFFFGGGGGGTFELAIVRGRNVDPVTPPCVHGDTEEFACW